MQNTPYRGYYGNIYLFLVEAKIMKRLLVILALFIGQIYSGCGASTAKDPDSAQRLIMLGIEEQARQFRQSQTRSQQQMSALSRQAFKELQEAKAEAELAAAVREFEDPNYRG